MSRNFRFGTLAAGKLPAMNTPTVFDTHTHLLFGPLGDDPDGAWKRAREAGVEGAVVIGIDAESSVAVADWVAAREGLWSAVGVHPNETAAASDEDWAAILELAERPEVVALGETGLDLHWDRSPLETQLRWLDLHAAAALERDLPLVLHVRDAMDEAKRALAPWAARGLRAVMHCFGGGPEDVGTFVDWGFFVSFAGNLTYRSAGALREAAALVPLEQCLVETDAPWLAPIPMRGRMNEPAHVVHTARCLAEVHGVEFEELAAKTTANAKRFFGL